MNRTFCLPIVFAVLLFGSAVVHGQAFLSAIDCSSVQSISFQINIANIRDADQWDFSQAAIIDLWVVNGKTDVLCKPGYDAANNFLFYGPFDVQTCGDAPTISSDGVKLEYEFVIDVLAYDVPATHQYDHQYTVKCLYNREQQNLMASFEPLHLDQITDSGQDDGTLLITFTLHLQSDDSELVGVIDLGTPIYGKVLVEEDAAFPFLDVHLQSVTASADNAGVVTPFTLVTDGCEEQHGLIDVDSVTCDTDADERFDMITNGAFRFPGQTNGDLVYFHATVIVCLSSNAASECQAECAAACPPAKRKRRETIQDAIQTTYYVKAGPYRIVDPNEGLLLKDTCADVTNGDDRTCRSKLGKRCQVNNDFTKLLQTCTAGGS